MAKAVEGFHAFDGEHVSGRARIGCAEATVAMMRRHVIAVRGIGIGAIGEIAIRDIAIAAGNRERKRRMFAHLTPDALKRLKWHENETHVAESQDMQFDLE